MLGQLCFRLGSGSGVPHWSFILEAVATTACASDDRWQGHWRPSKTTQGHSKLLDGCDFMTSTPIPLGPKHYTHQSLRSVRGETAQGRGMAGQGRRRVTHKTLYLLASGTLLLLQLLSGLLFHQISFLNFIQVFVQMLPHQRDLL